MAIPRPILAEFSMAAITAVNRHFADAVVEMVGESRDRWIVVVEGIGGAEVGRPGASGKSVGGKSVGGKTVGRPSVGSKGFGDEPELVALAQHERPPRVACFCTCSEAPALNHRCAHVLAAILQVQGNGRNRIRATARGLERMCPPEDDDFARTLAFTTMNELGSPDSRGVPVWDIDAKALVTDIEDARRALDRNAEPDENSWRHRLALVRAAPPPLPMAPAAGLTRLLFHVVISVKANARQPLLVEFRTADESVPGRIGGRSRFSATGSNWERLHPDDRDIALRVTGASRRIAPGLHAIEREHSTAMIECLARSGRALITVFMDDPHRASSRLNVPRIEPATPWRWVDEPIEARLELATTESGAMALRAPLRCGTREVGVGTLIAMLPDRLAIFTDFAAPLRSGHDLDWALELALAPLEIPEAEHQELLDRLADHPALPPMFFDPELAERLGIAVAGSPTRPALSIATIAGSARRVAAIAALDIDGVRLDIAATARTVVDPEAKRIVCVDSRVAARAASDLVELGIAKTAEKAAESLKIERVRIPELVRSLAERGWIVEVNGAVTRAARSIHANVHWNIDWFEVEGEIDFGDTRVPIARLFEAIRSRQGVITLADGTAGLIPDAWRDRFALAAHAASGVGSGDASTGAGDEDGGDDETDGGRRARFAPSQLMLLEAAIKASEQESSISFDGAAAQVRERLRGFEGLQPIEAPSSFVGTLRPYQRIGLGWFAYLQDFGLGGCLADDMGLGKTIQVLAMLDARRGDGSSRPPAGPTVHRPAGAAAEKDTPTRRAVPTSLVVAPRSLIHNWMAEAARFVPKLRVIDLSHRERRVAAEVVGEHDLALTTYGLLRSDIGELSTLEFDHVILDEAQAIKNAASQTARAAKLLRGRHRLALTGTPVENHLGELWSLVDFLNPAFLPRIASSVAGSAGSSGGYSVGGSGGGSLNSAEAAAVASAAVRPFILRRTKRQVAPELPDRIEQTVHCELKGTQRRLYERLRKEIRAALLGRLGTRGESESAIGGAGIEVLQGLLRLRQAACHPGLLDRRHAKADSAKFDALMPTLVELAEEGHKTLVFSQFTTLLDLVEPKLVEAGLAFERLDGSTRNRQERVERFQSDPQCPVFLLSLKAGGVGLNLTAADHVVLLDPWWNPAIEAQAIDRAHRIGQHRTVIATRLIAADTIEQRIVELQTRKREIFDAIVGDSAGPLAALTREDLERLLA